MEVAFENEVESETLSQAVLAFGSGSIGTVNISQTREGTHLLRMRDLSNEEHLALRDHLSVVVGALDERQYTTIGPTVGETLKQRAIIAITLASIAIVLYVAFAFRRVPRKLSPWRFGIIAVITLLHDILITVGVFVLISQFTSFEVDLLFVTALLTILGYSVNDTIVIFDRIRENMTGARRNDDFANVAEVSIRQSVARSCNTSVSTLVMLFCLYFLGSESIRWFVLTLIVGAVVGTYSSLCLATPMLVLWRKKGR